MENKTEIKIGIGFADSELISYSYSQNEHAISVDVLMWNEKKVKITFMGPIFFIDRGSFMLAMFCQQLNPAQLHSEALNRAYEEIPNDHPYKIYQFLDLDDNPTIEVMGTDYKVQIFDN